eukprot:1771660-Rhodomonas_salina.1
MACISLCICASQHQCMHHSITSYDMYAPLHLCVHHSISCVHTCCLHHSITYVCQELVSGSPRPSPSARSEENRRAPRPSPLARFAEKHRSSRPAPSCRSKSPCAFVSIGNH